MSKFPCKGGQHGRIGSVLLGKRLGGRYCMDCICSNQTAHLVAPLAAWLDSSWLFQQHWVSRHLAGILDSIVRQMVLTHGDVLLLMFEADFTSSCCSCVHVATTLFCAADPCMELFFVPCTFNRVS
jgi:hypothetical protein